MKKLNSGIVGLFILVASGISSFAIEGLHLSVQSSNVVLSWPSASNETYIAKYRQTLSATDSWVTLTNYLPPVDNTNITVFAHSGVARTNRTGFYKVARDGAHIFALTNNSVLSGEVQNLMEIGVDSTDQVSGVSFYNSADDSPVIGISTYTNSAGGWVFDWNTTLAENGTYNLYEDVDFITDDSVSSTNIPVSLTVSNVISFPNYFTRVFGNQMWIYAETIPNASYQLDIYDEDTNYLGSFADSADAGGVISFIWDLTDGIGDTFDSTNFYGVFTVDTSSPSIVSQPQAKSIGSTTPNFQTPSPTSATFGQRVHANTPGSSASANQLWIKEGNWTPNNNYVVAYSPLTDPAVDPNTALKQSLMMLGGSGGEYGGIIQTLDAYGLSGNLSPGNVAQSTAFEMSDTTSRSNLLSYLKDTRYENFYFFGHGNPSVIGGYGGANSSITAGVISAALDNVPLSYAILHVARHPYRFVFLDGCSTGAGTFCESFAVPAQSVSTNFFATAGVESRAFLGFKKAKSFNTSTWDSYALMMGGFYDEWLSGNYNLQQCVTDAQNGTFNSEVVTMSSSAVIYGAVDMMRFTRTRSP